MKIKKHESMNKKKPHIMMLTNHGVHEWQIRPGLIDTGGQNLFVNQFTDTLADMGFRITIINRGGYPHPVTGRLQDGIEVKDDSRRIVYITDDRHEFVRKEDMHEQIDQLALSFATLISAESSLPDFIISHYWDGAAIVIKTLELIKKNIRHIWIPHSLGEIKSRKTTENENAGLRMIERIEAENHILLSVETVVATSETVKNSLVRDYGYNGLICFIPPCIDDRRYYPFEVNPDNPIYTALREGVVNGSEELPGRFRLITEVSRTDTTKRKDVLIKAFAGIIKDFSDVILAVTIDKQSETGKELINLINLLGVAGRITVLGSVWEMLPALYNITDIYCSPSVMEGFGMSVQEAAACRTAIVASDLIPFAVEYLAGTVPNDLGAGAMIVKADNTAGFSEALNKLLSDHTMREQAADAAYRQTIPEFTWPRMVRQFLDDIGSGLNPGGR